MHDCLYFSLYLIATVICSEEMWRLHARVCAFDLTPGPQYPRFTPRCVRIKILSEKLARRARRGCWNFDALMLARRGRYYSLRAAATSSERPVKCLSNGVTHCHRWYHLLNRQCRFSTFTLFRIDRTSSRASPRYLDLSPPSIVLQPDYPH